MTAAFNHQPVDVHLCPKGLTSTRLKLPPMNSSSWSGSGQLFVHLNQMSLDNAAKFNALYESVSEHDRMIVDRMVRKRRNELARVEESQIARQFWEEERRIRQQEMLEHNEVATRLMRERREQDSYDTMVRLENLRNRDRYVTSRLRDELEAKECLVDMRLQRLNDQREHQTYQKRHEHMERAQLIAYNNEEAFLDQKMQQQWIVDHLEEKINRAEGQRQRYIEAQRSRVQWDNEVEQRTHQARLTANQRYEAFQRQKLMDTIRRSDQKTRVVLTNKQRELEQSRNHARNSAFLREFVRRSFTPDVSSMVGTANLFSTRSFKSV